MVKFPSEIREFKGVFIRSPYWRRAGGLLVLVLLMGFSACASTPPPREKSRERDYSVEEMVRWEPEDSRKINGKLNLAAGDKETRAKQEGWGKEIGHLGLKSGKSIKS